MNKKLALMLCLLALGLAGCAPSAASIGTAVAQTQAADLAAHNACTVDTVLKFTTTIDDVAQRWDDATKLANSTPRGNLSGQISNLQSLKREADAVEAPACLQVAKTNLVASMDATVTAFIDFLGQKPDATVTADFRTASTDMDNFHNQLDQINKCVPNCQ